MATNIDYEVIRLFNEYASDELIQSEFGSYICCYCNKIAVDIYSAICECKYCQVCVENKLELKSHKCDGLRTKECHEVNLMSFDEYAKDILADKRLMNKEVRCCFCDVFRDKMKNMMRHLDGCKETLFDTEMKKGRNLLIKIKITEQEKNLEGIKNQMNETNEEFRNKISSMEDKMENKCKELIGRMDEMQNKQINYEVHYKELTELFQVILENEDGRLINYPAKKYFLWIINDIHKKIENSARIYSPSFINNELYKMKLQLDANGYREEDRGYLSLYFVLCKGEYDDQVIWPFASTVKFELVNFTDGTKNVTQTLVAKTDNSNYQKPTTESNGGYGYGKFYNNKELYPDFIMNNSIWIRFYPNV